MIGAFHQPRAVLIDTRCLATLPPREYAAGPRRGRQVRRDPRRAVPRLARGAMPTRCARDDGGARDAIRVSCDIKAAIVARDERETGVRALLNFGHTFGHAIETGAGYGAWLHGEAVAAGMVLAARLSARVYGLPERDVARIAALLAAACDPHRRAADGFRAMDGADAPRQEGRGCRDPVRPARGARPRATARRRAGRRAA